jgi:hypothetical protein
MARTPKTPGAPPKKRGRKPKIKPDAFASALREPSPAPFSFPEPEVDDVEEQVDVSPDAIEINYDDGSVVVDFAGPKSDPEQFKDHDANLAEGIPDYILGTIAEDLLEGIQSDEDSRSEWMATRAKGIDLLGVKLESPRSGTASSAPLEGMSVVRDPVLLEAVLRFQANAQGELLPAAGPVKTVNYGGTAESDALADALERDLNYYLTSVASEYYPDSRRMFFWTGFAGMAFKKVYRCPLRRRPVSESVDAADLIVSDTITDLRNAQRITHQITMRPSVMKRMQIVGSYRDVELSQPTLTQNPVKEKVDQVQGLSNVGQRPADIPYTVYECYCELDIEGFEHTDEKGEPTGLPLPYRVTIEKDSRKILEIRRNWKEGDPDQQAKIPFVSYGYAPGLGFYNLGLLHILGNLTNALTAMTREAIDAGMFANFPGFLFAKSGARQMQNEFRIPPGGGLPIETGDKPIGQVVMPLPYKEAGPGHVALIAQLREVAGRLGGTADIAVGEGRQDAPVGSTVAMIEQATKIEGAVHKALHAAQAEEFRLLCELFREDPEALWRGNKRPALGTGEERLARFTAALDNSDIVPAADPNVPSHVHRIMKATAIKQLAAANPQMYNQIAVDSRVLSMLNVDRPQELFMPQQPQQPDPLVQAQIAAEQKKGEQKDKELELKALQIKVDADNDQKDREARQNVEVLKLAASLAANPASDAVVDTQLQQMDSFLSPLRSSPPTVGSARPSAASPSDLPPLRQRPSPSPVPPGLGGLMGLRPRSPYPFAMNGSLR